MEETSPRLPRVGALAALALAVGALASFGAGDAIGIASADAEHFFVLTWLFGWFLVSWAVIIAIASLIALTRRALARRPVSSFSLALLSACCALVVLAVSTQPLWGSGSGYGG